MNRPTAMLKPLVVRNWSVVPMISTRLALRFLYQTDRMESTVVAIALVGLNPIVLVWGLGGDHNDFLTVLLIVLGFYLLLRSRPDGVQGSGGAPGAALERISPARRLRAGLGSNKWGLSLTPLACRGVSWDKRLEIHMCGRATIHARAARQ